MTTTMLTKGSVKFQGQTVEFGKPVLVNGKKGTPFMAWVRTFPAHTTIRIKWEDTYMPSDFSNVYGRKAKIEEMGA